METPVAFPALGLPLATYVVNDREATLVAVQQDRTSVHRNDDGAFDNFDLVVGNTSGGSSVSEFPHSRKILVTSPTQDYGVLAVTLLSTNDEEPRTLHLDLRSKCSIYNGLAVAVKAFEITTAATVRGDANLFQLMLVDETAVVLTMRFTMDTLMPVAVRTQNGSLADLRCWEIRGGGGSRDSDSVRLCSTLVAFVDREILLLALHPHLVAANLVREETQVWTEAQCLEDMRSRASGMLRILKRGADMLTGGFTTDYIADTSPIAAVCAVNQCVFTLHSDGVLRHWIYHANQDGQGSSSLRPYAVRVVPVPDLPDTTTWLDGFNTTYLTASLQQGRTGTTSLFILGIYIHTSSNIALDDTSNSRTLSKSPRHTLMLVEGPVEFDLEISKSVDTGLIGPGLVFNVPGNVRGLVGMQFEHGGYCQLRAMFHTERMGSILVTYPVDDNTLGPIQVHPDYTLEGVAQQELERLEKLSFLPYCHLDDDMASIDDILHQIDSRFIQFLFRPVFPRGNGTILPPTEANIYSAMSKLVPSSSSSRDAYYNVNTSSVELQVVRFVQQWRRRDQHQNIIASMTPLRKNNPTASSMRAPDTAMACAPPNTPGADSILTLYDALDADEFEHDHDAGSQSPEEDFVEMDRTLVQDEQLVEQHECRWRSLLKEIWKEEFSDRSPLCMAVATPATADVAIVVRPGCISVLVRDVWSPDKTLHPLDTCALEMLTSAFANKCYAGVLDDAEMFAMEALARGEMALFPRRVQELKEKLNNMDVSLLTPSAAALWQRRTAAATNPWDGANLLGHPLVPGLCLLPTVDDATSTESRRRPVMSGPARLAVSSLVVRAADSARRLSLARFLALSEIMDSVGADLALLQYLHSLNVLLVAGRTVSFPPVASESTASMPQLYLDASSSPPAAKRTKVTSILEQTPNKTVVLDSLLIQMSQRVGMAANNKYAPSLTSYFSALCGAAVKLSLQIGNGTGSTEWGILPPEVGLLHLPAAGIDPQVAPLVVRLLAPAVALSLRDEPECDIKKRKVLLARCLLLACNSVSSPYTAKAMVARAFALLPFDANHTAVSMEHLGVLEARTGGNVVAGQRLLAYIQDAVVHVQRDCPTNSKQLLDSLHSRLFNTALTIRDWGTAHTACMQHPNLQRKAENAKRLVRGMVDAGALSALVQKCRSTHCDTETFQQVGSLYPIATETLAEIVPPDIYTFGESASDYQAALYNLHVSHGNWRSAAQALDARCLQARQVLAISRKSETAAIDEDEVTDRERPTVNDIVLGSIGTYNAMMLVTDRKSAYLVSGPQTLYPAIPPHAMGDRAGHGGVKHHRQGATCGTYCSEDIATKNQYLNMESIELRAVKCNVLKTLYKDDPTFSKAAIVGDDSADGEVIERLFLRGYYHEGLMLGTTMMKVEHFKPGGYGFFYDSLIRLIVDHLLPIALDKMCTPERPTLRQLQAGMECLGIVADPPVLIAGPRHKKASSLGRSDIRTAAMHFMRLLVVRYSTAEQPLAVELASEMLNGKQPLTVLPTWLEQILLFGIKRTPDDLPGLFARRRLCTTKERYLGDPIQLLSFYTHRGLYANACRLVCSVLEGPNHDFRQFAAPSRIPEMGEVDYLPRQKIDMLWHLIELSVKKGRLSDAVSTVLDARTLMENALTKYFELLAISESGSKSTRALTSSK